MPNHVDNIITIIGDSSTIELLDQSVHTSDKQPFDFHRIVPKPASLGRTERYWYEWEIAHWGTKWNAYDFRHCRPGRYRFCTAWAPPIPVIVALSRKFPDVSIEIDYDEEADLFRGVELYRNGQKVSG